MQEIVYRQLIPTDHPEYKRVRLDCLRHYPDHFGSTYEEEVQSESRLDDAIQSPDNYNFVFGAFAGNGTLIGICGYVTDKRLKTRHRGEIAHVFVDPLFGGQGIGKKLLRLSIEKAFQNPNTLQIILGVVYTNEKAIKLYRQLGFIEYGRLDNYFKAGDKYFTQLFFRLTREVSYYHKQLHNQGFINPLDPFFN